MANVHPRLGALKDPKDTRDYELRKVIKPVLLPASIDYQSKMAPVRDQGHRGSCVSFASAAVKEYQEAKQRKAKPQTFDFSEEWIYEQIMQPGGGAYPRDAFKLFVNSGVPKERYMAYQTDLSDDNPPQFKPTKAAIHNANYYKASTYARLHTIDEMKQSLVINGPFLIGVDWFDGWFHPKNQINGVPVMVPNDGSIAGGHALAIVGYDDVHQVFKFKNSWGTDWGAKGYAYFSYDVIRNNLLDAWAILDLTSKNIDNKVR